jgi:hypothetical protein
MTKHDWHCTFLSTETYEKTWTCYKCYQEMHIHLKSPAVPAEEGCHSDEPTEQDQYILDRTKITGN